MNHIVHAARAALAAVVLAAAVALGGCAVTIGSTGNTSAPASDSGQVAVKVIQGDNGQTLILVPITIHGKGPYTFALDTGASISLVDSAIASKLGLKDTGETSTVSGIGGAQNVTPIKISDWKAGDVSLPSATIARGDLPGAQHNSPLDGLLGSDVLSRFGRIAINFDSSTITLGKTSAAQSRGPEDVEQAREASRPRRIA